MDTDDTVSGLQIKRRARKGAENLEFHLRPFDSLDSPRLCVEIFSRPCPPCPSVVDRIDYAIIGCGLIGKNGSPVFLRLKNFAVACDTNLARAENW